MDPLKEVRRSLDDAIYVQVNERLEGIYCCLERRLIQPALVLLYSAIDSMAWLNMPAGQNDVKGKDFENWVDCYMVNPEYHFRKMVRVADDVELEVPKLSCSGADLYSARCGLVHSWTAESKLAREDKAKRVYYISGDVTVEQAMQEVRPELRSGLVFLKVETLVEVFRQAVTFFKHDIAKDENLRQRVEERACHFLFGS